MSVELWSRQIVGLDLRISQVSEKQEARTKGRVGACKGEIPVMDLDPKTGKK